MQMELTAIILWSCFGAAALFVGARVRRGCLQAHTASLRDRGEYKYQRVGQQQA